MPKSVYVVATIKALPGKETEAETLLKGLIAPTHGEAGCVRYALHKREDAPGTYFFLEIWRSPEDLQKHFTTPHIQAALAKQKDLLSLLDVATVTPLPGGDPVKGVLF